MKAVLMEKAGGPEVLRPANVDDPVITHPRQILVRIKAAGINPVDAKQRSSGTRFPGEIPQILGCDCAGVVEAVGKMVRGFRRGDEVYFMHGGIGREQGNYAELTVIDEGFAAAKPSCLSFVEAGGVPLALLTAWESLNARGNLKRGQTVLVHAGAGGVGHFLLQLAKLKGARVCTTVSDSRKEEIAKSLGADLVIRYREQDFVQELLEWTGGRGVDLAVDTVGGETFFRTIPVVRFYGRIVTLLGPKESSWGEARMRSLDLAWEMVLTPMYYGINRMKVYHRKILETCAKLFDEGKLRVVVSNTFPLAQAAYAHRALEEGHSVGKMVLSVD
jgi:NADPH2:quinone reductase